VFKKAKFVVLAVFLVLGISACGRDTRMSDARRYFQEGQLDRAISLYHEIIRDGRNLAEAHRGVGDVYLARGYFDNAMHHYTQSIGIDPQYATDIMVTLISHTNPDVRELVFSTIRYMPRNREHVIHAFMHDIEQASRYEKMDRLDAIMRIGSGASFMAYKVKELLEDVNWGVRRRAIEALYVLRSYESIGYIMQRLDDENIFVRDEAIRRLGYFGHASGWAMPRLIVKINDPSEMIRNSARYAIYRIGVAPREQVGELINLLHRDEHYTTLATLEVLERMGSAANEAVADIIPLLRSPSSRIRSQAAHALSRIGRADESVVPRIIELANDADDNIRVRVAFELGEIERFSESAMETLRRMARDASPQVQAAANTAIRNLEGRR